MQHIKRAIYQTGIWSRSLEPIQNLPPPSDFGWISSSVDPYNHGNHYGSQIEKRVRNAENFLNALAKGQQDVFVANVQMHY